MNDSKGAAFYASGNIAGEALRLYSTDLWTEACPAKAVTLDSSSVQRRPTARRPGRTRQGGASPQLL